MYELMQLTEKCYYIQCPAKIGLVQLNEEEVILIDSGNDKEAGKKVKKLLDSKGWRLKAILNTTAGSSMKSHGIWDWSRWRLSSGFWMKPDLRPVLPSSVLRKRISEGYMMASDALIWSVTGMLRVLVWA